MSSDSGSDSDSNRSASPISHGPAPTPGHGLDRSASNSPEFNSKRRDGSPAGRPASPASKASRSRSGSPVTNRSRNGSRSRSPSVESHKSGQSGRSGASRQSAGSNRSRQSRVSNRSRQSRVSNQSRTSRRSESGSNKSNRSGSAGSHRSRSSSAGSRRSRSGSAASNRSRTRSRSRSKSGSRSRSQSRSRSRSRSKSAASVESRRSRSGSRSRSPSKERRDGSGDRSRSNSPNLQIDEQGSPASSKGDKRKRDSSAESGPKRKNRIEDSDDDDVEKEDGKGVSAAAIFGDDADDISSEEEKGETEKAAESDKEVRRSDDEEPQRSEEEQEPQPEEDEDKENEPEPIPETRIDVEIPKISCDLGKDIHFVKLPNFLSVETRPFDPETYEDEIDEEETLDEEGRARLKLKVENTIRWRDNMDDEGNQLKESNARLVRWSDGSYSLHLGSEIFDVYKQPLQGDHNHLFIRQGTGLQGQAVFRTKLSFRPHSTESFTHRKMTLSLADRSQKTSGIKIISQVGADPDHDRKNLLKKEEEKLRQTFRPPSKPRKRGEGTRSHNASSNFRDEEGSDDEGAISLNAIKNKYKSGAGATAPKGGAIYSSDEEGSDIEARRSRKQEKTKALKESDSSADSD